MSNVCAHCGGGFSCGCQKMRAQDGQIIHKSCKTAYENKTKNVNQDTLSQQINNAQNNIIRK
jgi:hypothetical protein